MPGTKISQLPAAVTLTGSELVPIVQGGTTKRTTVGALSGGGSLVISFSDGTTTITNDSFIITGLGSATISVAGNTISINTPEPVQSVGPTGAVQLSDGSGSFSGSADLLFDADELFVRNGLRVRNAPTSDDSFAILMGRGDEASSWWHRWNVGSDTVTTGANLGRAIGSPTTDYGVYGFYIDSDAIVSEAFLALGPWGLYTDYPVHIGGLTTAGGTGATGTMGIGGTVSGGVVITLGNATLGITKGGTGAGTANDALNAFLPSQGGNTGKFLTTNGADASWATAGGGGGDGDVSTTTSNTFTVGPQVVMIDADANKGVVVVMHSNAQTGPMIQVLASDLTTNIFKVTGTAGDITVNGGNLYGAFAVTLSDSCNAAYIQDITHSYGYIVTATDSTHAFTVSTRSTTICPLSVKPIASQTAPVQEWQDSSGTRLSFVLPDGSLSLANILDTFAANSTLYYSLTAAKLVYKDSLGVVNALY